MTSEHPSPVEPPGRVFVGRKPELGALLAGLDRAIAGRGGVFLVAGEPGIGKSELADRLAAEATTRAAEIFWGRSWEGEGAPPYWPWAQIIRAHLEDGEGADLASIFGVATPYITQIVPELRDRLPDLPAPPPLDSEQARFRLFDAITTFLVRAAQTRPLVLILDDLHWADKPSLLLLRFLAREMGASRLLVVASYRDVEVSRGHPLAEVLPSLRQEPHTISAQHAWVVARFDSIPKTNIDERGEQCASGWQSDPPRASIRCPGTNLWRVWTTRWRVRQGASRGHGPSL